MSDRTDTDRLAEITARLDAATEGPWEPYDSNEGTEYLPMWSVANDDYHNPREDGVAFGASIECGEKADAELIAHAPADLAHLLSLAEQLQGQAASWQERFEDVRTELHRQLAAKDKLLAGRQELIDRLGEERRQLREELCAAEESTS